MINDTLFQERILQIVFMVGHFFTNYPFTKKLASTILLLLLFITRSLFRHLKRIKYPFHLNFVSFYSNKLLFSLLTFSPTLYDTATTKTTTHPKPF